MLQKLHFYHFTLKEELRIIPQKTFFGGFGGWSKDFFSLLPTVFGKSLHCGASRFTMGQSYGAKVDPKTSRKPRAVATVLGETGSKKIWSALNVTVNRFVQSPSDFLFFLSFPNVFCGLIPHSTFSFLIPETWNKSSILKKANPKQKNNLPSGLPSSPNQCSAWIQKTGGVKWKTDKCPKIANSFYACIYLCQNAYILHLVMQMWIHQRKKRIWPTAKCRKQVLRNYLMWNI